MSAQLPKALEALHNALADRFQAILDGGQPTAAELNTIRQFLKDNDVTLVQMLSSQAGGGPVLKLAESLPFKDDEEGPFDAKEFVG